MNAQDKNYLLLVPSRLTSNPQSISYRVEGQETAYTGMQTNEAVTKYLSDYLDRKNMKLDKVIMLCTEEVLNEKMSVIGGQTTLEYYQNTICEFLAQNGRYNSNTDAEALFEVIPYSAADYEVNEVRKPLDEIMRSTEEGEETSRKHLYVDFTGGPRSAALTLVFTCRILQRSGVAVEKILYSNIISSGPEKIGRIEECTKVYNVFAELEAAEAMAYGDMRKIIEVANEEGNKEVIDSLKNADRGMKKRKEANQMNQLEKMVEASENIVKAAGAMANQGNSLIAHLVSERIKPHVENSRKLVENPEYSVSMEESLEKKEYDKVISIFREKAIRMLIDFGVIEDNTKKKNYENLLTNEFMAAYCYYETPSEIKKSQENETVKKTFMDAARDYVKLLSESPEEEPVDILNKRDRSFYNLMERLEEIPADKLPRRFAHNDFSQRICNKNILPYLKQEDGINVDVSRLVEQYQRLERVYMGYGFPFACTYATWFFDEYEKLYRDSMKRGAISLQKFFNGAIDGRMQRVLACFPEESFTYRTLIQKLQEERYEKILHIIFPFQLSNKNIRPVALKGEKWEEFAYDFVQSFYSVKQVRNDVAHIGKLKDDDFKKAIQTVKRVLGQIKEIEDERNRKGLEIDKIPWANQRNKKKKGR